MPGLYAARSRDYRAERDEESEVRSVARENRIVRQTTDLAIELQKVYDSEINLEISWFWDGGIEIRLGDKINGFLAEATVASIAEIIPWVQEAIAHFYPDSDYAAPLDPEIKQRASQRVFHPPRIDATVIVPIAALPMHLQWTS